MGGRSNVFLVSGGIKNILVDTTVSRNRNALQRRLHKLGIHNLDFLVITHAHFDHAANANRIKETFHPRVIIHKSEEQNLRNGDNIIPEGTNIITRLIMNLLGKRLFHLFRYEPCIPDIVVGDRYDFTNHGLSAFLLHTPGHTCGSMSLVVDDEIALVGDTLFGVFKGSVFPPYARDKELMVKSWSRLLETGCSVFLPSHGSANSRAALQRDYNKRKAC